MEKIRVELGERSYDIAISDSYGGLASELMRVTDTKKILIVTDTNVYPLYAQTVQDELSKNGADVVTCVIPAGEENKNIDTVLYICRAAMEAGLDRKSMIAALGGGVVGDLAGFAAAVYMRGIDFIQLPTTLLSQSDSSVGGKTGFDFEGSKNIIGAFHQPRLVYINVSTLKTLPKREFISGMGEVIKHGIIRDAEFFGFLEKNADEVSSLGASALIRMCRINCGIKADVVRADEREGGLRAILNFGHTIGHAIESACDFTKTHGECVGLGMAAAAYISVQRGIADKGVLERICAVLRLYGFDIKTKLPSEDVIFEHMGRDKKKTNGRLRFVLPEGIGSVIFADDITNEEISAAMDFIGCRASI